MDMLVLGNSASNFVVYCLMSTKFRRTLLKVDHLGRVPPPILVLQVLTKERGNRNLNTPRLTQVSRSSMV